MRFKKYLSESNELISDSELKNFENIWKGKLKQFGLTNFKNSDHFDERIRHTRNVPPISLDELNLAMNAFIRQKGSQLKQDIEQVKKHALKPRGKDKKKLNFNELEFTISSVSTGVNLTLTLKQDRKTKGTAMLLPVTVIRKKKGYFVKQGEQYVVEGVQYIITRREIWD
jgi:hypothetical protein